jgi:hypothetical protein
MVNVVEMLIHVSGQSKALETFFSNMGTLIFVLDFFTESDGGK